MTRSLGSSNRTQKMNMLFAVQEGDKLGLEALGVLRSFGLDVHVVRSGELAPVGSICLYTSAKWKWTSKHLRVAAHRLYPGRPQWAISTPFLIEIKPLTGRNFADAVFEVARMYQTWFRGDAGVSTPWECLNNRPTTYTELLEGWFDLLEGALGSELTQELLTQMPLVQHRGRGGEVVYRLMDTGRVVMSKNDLPPNLRGNDVYREIADMEKPVVSYGTSDLANVFELLEALKLGSHLDLPVVFENYPGAHNWGYWLEGFLKPSLVVLGVTLDRVDFGFQHKPEHTKYTELIEEAFVQALVSLNMPNSARVSREFVGQPLWVLYQHAMQLVADMFLEAVGAQVVYAQTTTQRIVSETELWRMSARDIAKTVQEAAGHGVVVFNGPQGQQVRSDDWRRLPDATVSELHRDGWWLGGACLYYLLFRLGLNGGIVMMVKDSTAGRVNLMARPYLGGDSGLYLAPVGLFRLTSEGQNEDWSIDPLVFWELLHRWSPKKAKEELRKIWAAMEVPLERAHIGRKTVATVTKNGVSISVEN